MYEKSNNSVYSLFWLSSTYIFFGKIIVLGSDDSQHIAMYAIIKELCDVMKTLSYS